MSERAPKFIVFEGIDGSGKSTHAKSLVDRLTFRGIETVLTCEPTRTGEAGKLLRRMIAGEVPPLAGDAMALLFEADRLDHKYWIRDMLRAGVTVVSDRYELSTIAYQATWSLSDPEEVRSEAGRKRSLLRRIQRHYPFSPDLMFVMNLPVEEALARVGNRGKTDLYEHTKSLEQAAHYYRTSSDTTGPIVYIDARQPQALVQEAVDKEVEALWAAW